MAVADALSWTEPFFIVGHSHGGGVAQIAAAKYPETIAGIVLISTLSARQHSSYRFYRFLVRKLPCDWLASLFARLHFAQFADPSCVG